MNDIALSDPTAAAAALEATPAVPTIEEVIHHYTADQVLRCFIVEHFGSAEYDFRAHIIAMQAVFEWITEGRVPPKEPAKRRGEHLKTV